MAGTKRDEDKPPSTKPGGRVAADVAARKRRQDAPTMPPPATIESGVPPQRAPLASEMRPKRQESTPAPRTPSRPAPARGRTRTLKAPSAVVDEVVADLRKDPRVDDDE
jgi:hypothetical protein